MSDIEAEAYKILGIPRRSPGASGNKRLAQLLGLTEQQAAKELVGQPIPDAPARGDSYYSPSVWRDVGVAADAAVKGTVRGAMDYWRNEVGAPVPSNYAEKARAAEAEEPPFNKALYRRRVQSMQAALGPGTTPAQAAREIADAEAASVHTRLVDPDPGVYAPISAAGRGLMDIGVSLSDAAAAAGLPKTGLTREQLHEMVPRSKTHPTWERVGDLGLMFSEFGATGGIPRAASAMAQAARANAVPLLPAAQRVVAGSGSHAALRYAAEPTAVATQFGLIDLAHGGAPSDAAGAGALGSILPGASTLKTAAGRVGVPTIAFTATTPEDQRVETAALIAGLSGKGELVRSAAKTATGAAALKAAKEASAKAELDAARAAYDAKNLRGTIRPEIDPLRQPRVPDTGETMPAMRVEDMAMSRALTRGPEYAPPVERKALPPGQYDADMAQSRFNAARQQYAKERAREIERGVSGQSAPAEVGGVLESSAPRPAGIMPKPSAMAEVMGPDMRPVPAEVRSHAEELPMSAPMAARASDISARADKVARGVVSPEVVALGARAQPERMMLPEPAGESAMRKALELALLPEVRAAYESLGKPRAALPGGPAAPSVAAPPTPAQAPTPAGTSRSRYLKKGPPEFKDLPSLARTIASVSREFKENPTVTVEGETLADRRIVIRAGRATWRILPEAVGIERSALKPGESMTIDLTKPARRSMVEPLDEVWRVGDITTDGLMFVIKADNPFSKTPVAHKKPNLVTTTVQRIIAKAKPAKSWDKAIRAQEEGEKPKDYVLIDGKMYDRKRVEYAEKHLGVDLWRVCNDGKVSVAVGMSGGQPRAGISSSGTPQGTVLGTFQRDVPRGTRPPSRNPMTRRRGGVSGEVYVPSAREVADAVKGMTDKGFALARRAIGDTVYNGLIRWRMFDQTPELDAANQTLRVNLVGLHARLKELAGKHLAQTRELADAEVRAIDSAVAGETPVGALPERLRPLAQAWKDAHHDTVVRHYAERIELAMAVREEFAGNQTYAGRVFLKDSPDKPGRVGLERHRHAWSLTSGEVGLSRTQTTSLYTVLLNGEVARTGGWTTVDGKRVKTDRHLAAFDTKAEADAFASQLSAAHPKSTVTVREPMTRMELYDKGLDPDFVRNVVRGAITGEGAIGKTRLLSVIPGLGDTWFRDKNRYDLPGVSEAEATRAAERDGFKRFSSLGITLDPSAVRSPKSPLSRLRDGFVEKSIANDLTRWLKPTPEGVKWATQYPDFVPRALVTRYNPYRHFRQPVENMVTLALVAPEVAFHPQFAKAAVVSIARRLANRESPFSTSKEPQALSFVDEVQITGQRGSSGWPTVSGATSPVEGTKPTVMGRILDTKVMQKARVVDDAVLRIYSAWDLGFKEAVYHHLRTSRNMSPEDAYRRTEDVTFNFRDLPPVVAGAARVSPFIASVTYNYARIFGTAFKNNPIRTTLTFAAAAAGFGAWRQYAKEKYGITPLETEKMGALDVPVGRDEQGRPVTWNAQWITPFADLVTRIGQASEDRTGAALRAVTGLTPLYSRGTIMGIAERDVVGNPWERRHAGTDYLYSNLRMTDAEKAKLRAVQSAESYVPMFPFKKMDQYRRNAKMPDDRRRPASEILFLTPVAGVRTGQSSKQIMKGMTLQSLGKMSAIKREARGDRRRPMTPEERKENVRRSRAALESVSAQLDAARNKDSEEKRRQEDRLRQILGLEAE